jgi:hypothetical protein
MVAGAAILILLWSVAVLVEPYLVAAAAMPPSVEPRGRAGWGNTNVWLAAEVTAIAVVLAAGFAAKRLSPVRSWIAPAALFLLCLAYSFFAQFPATESLWRIALWSLGPLVAFSVGALFGRG